MIRGDVRARAGDGVERDGVERGDAREVGGEVARFHARGAKGGARRRGRAGGGRRRPMEHSG